MTRKKFIDAVGNLTILAWFSLLPVILWALSPSWVGIFEPLNRAETLVDQQGMRREVNDSLTYTHKLIMEEKLGSDHPIQIFAHSLEVTLLKLDQSDGSLTEFQRLRDGIRNMNRPTFALWKLEFPYLYLLFVVLLSIINYILKERYWYVR